MQRMLIAAGLLILILGLLWPWLSKLPFGQLPGDVSIEKENLRFYFPITTMIVVSLAISLLFWLFRR